MKMSNEREAKIEAQIQIMNHCRDWAEDHTYLQNLCRQVGCSEFEVEGDSYGVPGIQDLADLLFSKIPEKVNLEWEQYQIDRLERYQNGNENNE